MSTRPLFSLLVFFASTCSFLYAQEDDGRRTFAQQKCTLTLPENAVWIDKHGLTNVLAAFQCESGELVTFMSQKADVDAGGIDQQFATLCDKGLCENGVATKLAGRLGSFLTVPCYTVSFKVKGNDDVITVRAFVANDLIYQLQVMRSDLPLDQRDKLEAIFNSFAFMGTPSLPKPRTASSSQVAESNEYAFSEKMGKVAAYCIIGILVLAVLGKASTKRKKKDASADDE